MEFFAEHLSIKLTPLSFFELSSLCIVVKVMFLNTRKKD